MYWDQGINTEEYKRDTYGDLMKTQCKEEDEVKYNVAKSANDSLQLERQRRKVLAMKMHMTLVRVTP